MRVRYHGAGEVLYHVDLAFYSESPSNGDNKLYLAKGFLGSKPENQIWEVAETKRLVETVQQKFQHQGDRDQFRRIIRYLKRWKDVTFSANGNERPTGIAITACALNWFQVSKSDEKCDYDDLKALKNLAKVITSQFIWPGRMTVNLPVPPNNNLFEKMSNREMKSFRNKLEVFRDTLTQV